MRPYEWPKYDHSSRAGGKCRLGRGLTSRAQFPTYRNTEDQGRDRRRPTPPGSDDSKFMRCECQ